MVGLSYEEIRRILRKIEFDKTEPKLLTGLIDKAIRLGERERRRISKMRERIGQLSDFLQENGIILELKPDANLLDQLKKSAGGALDGRFQVISGSGGQWFGFFGFSRVLAKDGFCVNPEITIEALIEPFRCADESEAKIICTEIMMRGESKTLRYLGEELRGHEKSYILIDGPIIDPPLYKDPDYISFRASTIKFCINGGISVIGFVKRIVGSGFIKFLKSTFEERLDLSPFFNDADLLSGLLYMTFSRLRCQVYTKPVNLFEFLDKNDPMYTVYSLYSQYGFNIYHSYYKPALRSRVYRIELASASKLTDDELKSRIKEVLSLICYVWTLPGMNEPLPILLAHEKCNIRQGAAEKLYYEIITRSLTEEEAHLWLS
ncbi:MAG: DNA double-strand break repair nuclease NurA [Crenarchaeota archaeon]|nr:DNA double-strand break repair nuclease NurA [Thermoproteota archaeon]